MPKVKPNEKKNNDGKEKVYRNYNTKDLNEAAKLVRDQGMTIYKATKTINIPWSSLKRFICSNNVEVTDLPKLGRPFALSAKIEQKIFHYIVDMQELGFGLTVDQVRTLAYKLAKACGREHFFSLETGKASKWWWGNFKSRYGLSLRVPENLSAYRASMANKVIIDDFYRKLTNLLTKLGIENKPSLVWNCDETGLSYVVKPNMVVAAVGKKYVYKRSFGERGETHTVLGCVCADGSWIPPMIIFKGVRWNDMLEKDSLPNALIKLSPKGWINSDLFLEWFQFFIASIPTTRPVVLVMDSHASHLSPEVLKLAKENQVYLFTFPAHTSHLLQPLDVGVYRPLKAAWSKSLNAFMREHPGDRVSRYNFNSLFNPAFITSFSIPNIVNSFRKTGIMPLNPQAITPEAIGPSRLTERANPEQATHMPVTPSTSTMVCANEVSELLTLPSASRTHLRPKKDSSAKCLNPPEESLPLPGPSHCDGSTSHKQKMAQKDLNTTDNDWTCGTCFKTYNEDCKKKTGKKWIQCSFCLTTYHETCQSHLIDSDPTVVYMCDVCETDGLNSSDSDVGETGGLNSTDSD